jgi:vacuolar-type H+-ATPase subunit C/Vma6
LAALLVAWGHPLGGPLLAATADASVKLPTLEQSLHGAFARHASAAARKGDAALRSWVRAVIDADNALTLATLLQQPAVTRDPAAWVPGGARLQAGDFARVLEADSVEAGMEILIASLAGSPLQAALRRYPPGDGRVELAVLSALLSAQLWAARRAPLGTAPVLAYVLRLRAEAIDLRTIVWGASLGAPAGMLESLMVTP